MKVNAFISLLSAAGLLPTTTQGSRRQFEHPRQARKSDRVRKAELGNSDWHTQEHFETGEPVTEFRDNMKYIVIYEKWPSSWGAYCPDLPGLGVAGDTFAEVQELIHEAIPFHIQGLRESGDPIPQPSQYELFDVAA